jgi:hypothetical protein
MGYQKDEHDTKFYRAVRKYGVENFQIELLDTANSREELNDKEEFWILKLNAICDGYNTALGRIGGDTLSKNPNLSQIKDKIRQSKMGGKNPNATKVIAVNLENGERVKYDSVIECQNDLNIPRHDIITRRCDGKIKKRYNKIYMFEYVKEGVTTIES